MLQIILLLILTISFSLDLKYYNCYKGFCGIVVRDYSNSCYYLKVECKNGLDFYYPKRVCFKKYKERLVLIKTPSSNCKLYFLKGSEVYKSYNLKVSFGEKSNINFIDYRYLVFSIIPLSFLLYAFRSFIKE